MERYSFTDIVDIMEKGILLCSGTFVSFSICAKIFSEQNGVESKCVAQRDITVGPPYIEFFTPDKTTRIEFDRKGLFCKSRNKADFRFMSTKISEFGYTTYDLS